MGFAGRLFTAGSITEWKDCRSPRVADELTIALLAALPGELTPITRRLALTRLPTRQRRPAQRIATGVHRGATIDAYLSGMGQRRVRACLAAMLAARRPHAIIHMGFAGALSPTLEVGEVIEPYVFQCATPGSPPRRTFSGTGATTLLTVDHPVLEAAEKSRLYDAHGCPDAVDMETHAGLELCHAAGVEHHAVRAITDRYDQSLPMEVTRWLDGGGRPRALSITRDLLRRPGLIHHLWTLRAAARQAAAALAARVPKRLDEIIDRRS